MGDLYVCGMYGKYCMLCVCFCYGMLCYGMLLVCMVCMYACMYGMYEWYVVCMNSMLYICMHARVHVAQSLLLLSFIIEQKRRMVMSNKL